MNSTTQRSKDGRYDVSKLETACRCGHTLGAHYAAGERACVNGPHGDSCAPSFDGRECGCVGFKKSKR